MRKRRTPESRFSTTADQAVTVDFMIRNSDGNNLDSAELILEPGEHRALFLDQIGWQTDFDFGTFLGTMVAIPRSGSVAATVIQTRPGQFATLPWRTYLNDGIWPGRAQSARRVCLKILKKHQNLE